MIVIPMLSMKYVWETSDRNYRTRKHQIVKINCYHQFQS